jgi:hypothetical protein
MSWFRLPFQRPKSLDEHRRNGETIQAWLQRYAFRAIASAATSLPPGFTKVNFATLLWEDLQGSYSTGTSTYTVQQDGLYHVDALVPALLGNNPQIFVCSVFVNGTRTMDGNVVTVRAGTVNDEWGSMASGQIQLRKGDTVDARMYNNGGNTVSTDTFITNATQYFSIARIGPYPSDVYR